MKSMDNVGVTFVNTVVGRGILNGVVNLSFAVLNFTPADDSKAIDPDPVVNCRLRMDKLCAKQLRDVLNDLIDLIDKAEHDAVAQSHMNGAGEGVAEKKPN